jgi:hypothetical protein
MQWLQYSHGLLGTSSPWLYCPGSRLFYFLGRTLHSTRNLKRFGEYPREIAGSLDFEMRGLHNIADTFCIAQFEVVVKFVGSN